MATVYPIGSQADGGIKYSDGSIKYSTDKSATGTGTAGYATYSSNSGSVLGANTTAPQPTNNNPPPSAPPKPGTIPEGGQPNVNGYLNEFGQWTPITDADRERGRLANEAKAREDALRGTINSGFDSLKQGYNDLLPYYSQEGDRRVGQVGDTYNNIFGGLDTAKQAGQATLNNSRAAVATRSANSVADLKDNLNQVMRNTGMQLGAMGAGDTSASQVMAPYAYTKMAGAQFGGIARQANDQYGTLDQKGIDLEQQYAQLYNQTEIEKSQQIEAIKSDVGAQIARIREMIPGVDASRAQALAGLEQSLLTQAQAQLTQLQAEDRQKKDSLQQWALNRMSQLQDAQLSIKNTANFDPQAITFNALQSVGAMPAYGQSAEAYYNPALLAQKRREELGLTTGQ